MHQIGMKPPRILVVDDDSIVIKILHEVLKGIGAIQFAMNAEQAFRVINTSRPDIILLDMELPDSSGLDICLRLKQSPETTNIPILFITGIKDDNFEEIVFDAGAADYITKPFNPKVVAARVRTHLGYHKAISLLDEKAHTDFLTGLGNRRLFNDRLNDILHHAKSLNNTVSVIMADIDEFKKYNDHFGHMLGDECIRKVAYTIAESFSAPDMVCARYGGEEFAIILPNKDHRQTEPMIEAMMQSIRELNLMHAPEAAHSTITVSIGYSSISYASVNELYELDDWVIVKVADLALYEAKRLGRDRYTYRDIRTQG